MEKANKVIRSGNSSYKHNKILILENLQGNFHKLIWRNKDITQFIQLVEEAKIII